MNSCIKTTKEKINKFKTLLNGRSGLDFTFKVSSVFLDVFLGFWDVLSDWIYYGTIEFRHNHIKDCFLFFQIA